MDHVEAKINIFELYSKYDKVVDKKSLFLFGRRRIAKKLDFFYRKRANSHFAIINLNRKKYEHYTHHF